MKPPPFTYHDPRSIEDAVALLEVDVGLEQVPNAAAAEVGLDEPAVHQAVGPGTECLDGDDEVVVLGVVFVGVRCDEVHHGGLQGMGPVV